MSETNVQSLLDERVTILHECEQAGRLFKSTEQSPLMCTSLLRHDEQRDACVEPRLAYCGAGLLKPSRLANQIWNHHICEAYRHMQNKYKETATPIMLLIYCS